MLIMLYPFAVFFTHCIKSSNSVYFKETAVRVQCWWYFGMYAISQCCQDYVFASAEAYATKGQKSYANQFEMEK